MFSAKHFISNVKDVPANWIFQKYLGLKQPLTGQSVRIRSIFNPNDRDPSMYLYYNKQTNCYKYKCFSTGSSGDAINLMMHIWGVSFAEAAKKIMDDYVNNSDDVPVIHEMTNHPKWKVENVITRSWTKDDANFWSPYNIDSDLLEEYNVIPLKSYDMHRKDSEGVIHDQFTVSGKNVYGYYTNAGDLHKIYQPYNKDKKFLKIMSHLQGYDQNEGNDYLIIASSLKDIMSMKSLGIKADFVAPDSENTMFSQETIDKWKEEYESIVTLLDSDAAGVKAMTAYFDNHMIPFVYLPAEKDISDIVKHRGVDTALAMLVPKLNNALSKYKSLQVL